MIAHRQEQHLLPFHDRYHGHDGVVVHQVTGDLLLRNPVLLGSHECGDDTLEWRWPA